MLPEFASFGFYEERLGLLSDELAVRIGAQMVIGLFLNRSHSLVRAWSRRFGLLLCVLAVGHLRLEHSVLAGRVELLLSLFFEIVDTWSRIIAPAHIVMSIIVLSEYFAIDLAIGKVVDGCLRFDHRLFWVVGSWTYHIKTSACVCSCCKFFCRYRGSMRIRYNCHFAMLFVFVFQKGLVQVFQVIPLGCIVIGAGVRIFLVCWPLHKA